MLVDEREAEPGALAAAAPTGRRAAGEALEDQRPLLDRDAGTVVLDGDWTWLSGSSARLASVIETSGSPPP